MSDYIARARKIIADHLGIDQDRVTPDAVLSDLGADSLDHIELVMAFEEAFGFEISDDEAEHVLTVQQVFDLLTRLVGAKTEAVS